MRARARSRSASGRGAAAGPQSSVRGLASLRPLASANRRGSQDTREAPAADRSSFYLPRDLRRSVSAADGGQKFCVAASSRRAVRKAGGACFAGQAPSNRLCVGGVSGTPGNTTADRPSGATRQRSLRRLRVRAQGRGRRSDARQGNQGDARISRGGGNERG